MVVPITRITFTLRLTGTVYKTLGFAFDDGQFSRIERNDCERMPCESVSTSVRISE